MKHTWLLFMAIFSLLGVCRAAGAIKVHKVAPSFGGLVCKTLNCRFYCMAIISLLPM